MEALEPSADLIEIAKERYSALASDYQFSFEYSFAQELLILHIGSHFEIMRTRVCK